MDPEKIKVEEAQDGTAVVTLDDDKAKKQEPADDTQHSAADDTGSDAGDGRPNEDDDDSQQHTDESGDAELAAAADDDEREQIRARRREERKARKLAQREMSARKDREIEMLREQVARLSAQVGGVTVNQQAERLSRMRDAVGELEARASELQEIIASDEATGAQRAEATRQLIEVERRKNDLALIVDRGVKTLRQQAMRGPDREPSATSEATPDPRLVSNAGKFMSKHRWFNLNGTDADSRVAKSVDAALYDEGWDPTTPAYWTELEKRLKTYLPHRFSGYNGNQSGSGGNNAGRQGPRAPASSGQSADATGGGNTFTLSQERVQAIKDAGMWDDPKKRAQAIRRYREYDSQQRAGK